MQSANPVETLPASATATRRRSLRVGPVARRRLVVWCPPVLVALLFLPFVLRENVWWEWNNAYWFIERQAAYISEHGVPTLFVHTTNGVFYPMPVYYGGFTFAALAYPAAVLGTWPTFVAATVGAYVAGYFGIWWMARNLGLSRGLAVLPALSFVCAPYMVATFYGRGAWAEVIGLNAAAVVLGAATSLLWHPERRARGAIAALVPASALVAGTHNLTLMMSAIVLPLIILVMLPTKPKTLSRGAFARQLGWLSAGVLVGIGLTAAWLLPNLWFSRETLIAGPTLNQAMLENFQPFTTARVVLSPWPNLPEGLVQGFQYSQPSVLVGAWTIVAAILLVRGRRALVSLAGLTVLGAALLLVICTPSWWPHFPDTIRAIQMPVRVVPYVGVVIAVACVTAIAAMRPGRARRALLGVLVVVVGAQFAMGMFVAFHTESSSTPGLLAPKHEAITAGTEPPSFSTQGLVVQIQFLIGGRPTATATDPNPVGVQFRDGVTSVAGTLSGRAKVGDRLTTLVDWSPYVTVGGDATLIGRNGEGMSIVRVNHVDRRGTWNATAQPICSGLCLGGDAPWQLGVGRLITLLCTLLVASFALLWSWQALRARRARRTVASG